MGRQVETTGPEFTPTKGAVISVRAASVGKRREQGNGTASFSGRVYAPGQTCGPIALAQGESILSPGGILSEQGRGSSGSQDTCHNIQGLIPSCEV